uniref:PH domain-containing protein n=1 Tax=Anabas testudineus TaxID=64144 RepID=A0A3Q1I9T8_ANATE
KADDFALFECLSMVHQDKDLLRQIEMEVRMQEGASKLLAACSQKEQALEASKSLLTCNARILALLSELQRVRKAQILQREGCRSDGAPKEDLMPCTGKVALSDLRIPLMWKDSEYFKNKGELHRCAVFCLLQCGTQIHDTDLVMVDRTLTDICFEDTITFDEVGPGFQLRVELYSSCVAEDFSLGALGPRRMSRLGGSLGCSSGKKIRAALESAAVCGSTSSEFCLKHTIKGNYNLLAYTTQRIEHIQDSFKTHDLSLAASEDSPFWLPLYGNMCCRLVAQPLCMIQPVIRGQLKVKLGEDLNCWENVYGVLRGQSLCCYQSQEDLESEDKPLLVIPIRKDTTVCVSESDPVQFPSIHISTPGQGEDVTYVLTMHKSDDMQRWTEALRHHIYNIGVWKQCCDHLMKIEMPSSRRSITAKQGSLYHEIGNNTVNIIFTRISHEGRLAFLPHSKKGPGFNPRVGRVLFGVKLACSPCVYMVSLQVLRFPPTSKGMHIKLIGDS